MLNFNHGSGPLNGSEDDPYNVSDTVNRYIDDGLYRRYVEKRQSEDRNYVGMSELGDRCIRRLYYRYSGAPQPPITGEKMRRFEMGHYFEELVYVWLMAAGFNIRRTDSKGNQFEFSTAGGKIKGHIDGVILSGPPVRGLIYPALWENKAIMAKYWNEIVKKGLQKAEPKYYAQTIEYMAYGELPNALFTALNKDTAEIHHKVIMPNMKDAQKYSDRGVDVIRALEAKQTPPRISAHADFFICKQCEYHDFCWSSPV